LPAFVNTDQPGDGSSRKGERSEFISTLAARGTGARQVSRRKAGRNDEGRTERNGKRISETPQPPAMVGRRAELMTSEQEGALWRDLIFQR
jgi:hypothetical protein